MLELYFTKTLFLTGVVSCLFTTEICDIKQIKKSRCKRQNLPLECDV